MSWAYYNKHEATLFAFIKQKPLKNVIVVSCQIQFVKYLTHFLFVYSWFTTDFPLMYLIFFARVSSSVATDPAFFLVDDCSSNHFE